MLAVVTGVAQIAAICGFWQPMSVGRFRGIELAGLEVAGERLLLRPWQPGDAAAVFAALRTGQLHRFLALPDPYTEADAAQFVGGIGPNERAAGTGMECAVVERASGVPVGSATLRLPLGLRAADIGYWIAPDAQRQGYAAEATRALAGWAHEHGVYRVELRLDVTNTASARVALSCGFGFEGLRRDALPVGEGRHDMAVFVRTADDPDEPIPAAFASLPAGGLTDGTLSLRVLSPDDIEPFAELENDPLTRTVGFTAATPPRRAMERLLAQAELDLLVGPCAGFAMVDVATGAFAGSLRLRVTGPPAVGGVGYAVHPAFRGRGYAGRALELLAGWAFDGDHFARLELGAKVDNVASQRAALSAGFGPDGVWSTRLRNPDGTFSDEARFSRVNPRYS